MSKLLGGKKQTQTQSSKPVSAAEVATYYNQLDELSGGRLADFSKTGTAETNYTALGVDQVKALGGYGATRRNQVDTSRANALEEIRGNSALTLSQKSRSKQLTNQGANDQLDAILKETEAQITTAAQTDNQNSYQAALNNSTLTRDDMETLARIFYGGTGQTSTGAGSSSSSNGLGSLLSFSI